MRIDRTVLRWGGVGVLLAVFLVLLDHQASRMWPPRHALDRKVTASSAFLRTASFGMRALVADYLWIDAVQYFGHTLGMHSHEIVDGTVVERGLVGPHVHTAANTFALLVTRLLEVDPHFARPPLLAALFLIDPHADPVLGVSILSRASRLNPTHWQIRLFHGYYRYAVLRDKERARTELEAAESCRGRPEYVREVRHFFETASDSLLARVFYSRASETARTDTERRLLAQRLEEIEAGLGGFGHTEEHAVNSDHGYPHSGP